MKKKIEKKELRKEKTHTDMFFLAPSSHPKMYRGAPSRIQFPDAHASHVGSVCWFSSLLREVFSLNTYFGFPSAQNVTYDLILVV